MSDSTVSVVGIDDDAGEWYEGMSAVNRAKCEAKAQAAADDIASGDKSYLAAATKLETVYTHYLKGDRKRFESFVALPPLRLNGSMGYVYVQAARAGKTFAEDIAKVTDQPVSVQSLAKLDRFVGDKKGEAVARRIIATEGKRAKATGAKPLTQTAVTKAVQAATPGETADRTETRTGRIASKLRDTVRASFTANGGTESDSVARAAFLNACKLGAEWGAAYGAVTPLALDRLAREWAEDIAERATVQGAAASLKPDSKPVATVKQTRKPATRSGRTNTKPVQNDVGSLAKVAAK